MPRRLAHLTLLLAACLAPALLGGEDAPDPRVKIEGWQYARSRKTITGSNKVTCAFTLENVTGQPLEELVLVLGFSDAMGQPAGDPITQRVGRVNAKEKKHVEMSAEWIPVFQSYELYVRHKDGQERWHSSSDTGNPSPKAEKSLKGVASARLLGSELNLDGAGRLAGPVRVKNEGDQVAKNIQVFLKVYGPEPRQPARPPAKTSKTAGKTDKEAEAAGEGPKRPIIKEWTGPLGDGTLKGGEERIFQLSVPLAVARTHFTGYSLSIGCDEASSEAAMSGGEFQNLNDLESAHYKFKRTGENDADLSVSCRLRNGLKEAAGEIKLDLVFFKNEKDGRKEVKKHRFELKDPIAPGAEQDVSFVIPQVPKYDSFEQAMGYGAVSAKKTAPKGKTPEFTNAETVEVLLKEFSPRDDGSLVIVCAARNGRPHHVKEIKVIARFLKADGSELTKVEKVLPDAVAPGDVRNFILRAEGAKEYANVTTEVGFVEIRPAQKTQAPEEAKTGEAAAESPAEAK